VTVVGPSGLPPWVIAGVALGAVASVGVALVFYFGSRLSPPREQPGGNDSGGIGERRHAEIRAYLGAIDERFHEHHTIGEVTVPFYLPARDVAVTFDAHDYFRLDGTDVYAVLCEHEMPGRGLGRRLPFDVSEPDQESPAGRSAPNRSVTDAFAELGLPPSADADAVRDAYRERVKDAHPDRGGDEETFRRVQEAYATASDHADGSQPPSTRAGARTTRSGFGR